MDVPLTEFDSDPDSFLVPSAPVASETLPEAAVLCFFPEVLEAWAATGRLRAIGAFSRQLGGATIYSWSGGGVSAPVAVFHPGVGAPLAGHCLEQAIAGGVRQVVACGGAGALSSDFAQDMVLVVSEAVRDEGTSYHYAPPGRTIVFDARPVAVAADVLRVAAVPYLVGKSWTTDADYRETRGKIAARRAEGCVAVEMEAAALAAICAFRGVSFVQLLYSGDDLTGQDWRGRDWTLSSRRGHLLELALDTVAAL